jgi:hypothetical protein
MTSCNYSKDILIPTLSWYSFNEIPLFYPTAVLIVLIKSATLPVSHICKTSSLGTSISLGDIISHSCSTVGSSV